MGLSFLTVGLGAGGQGAGHMAWEKGKGEQMQNVRCLDQGQESMDSLSAAEADHGPRVGPHGRQRGAALGEWERESPGSWLIANTLCNGNGVLNRIKLGRQNKAIPLNKCSALKQPE